MYSIIKNTVLEIDKFMNILIVGAGVAGLTLASVLEQHDISFDIIEKQSTINASSYCFGLHSSGISLLNEMNLLGNNELLGNNINSFIQYDHHNKVLEEMHSETWGEVVRRHDLVRKLSTNIHQPIQYDTTIQHINQNHNGVFVTLKDQRVTHYDLVVGADGVFSNVRSCIAPSYHPEFTGFVSANFWLTSDQLQTSHTITRYSLPHNRGMYIYKYAKNSHSIALLITTNDEANHVSQADIIEMFTGYNNDIDTICNILKSVSDQAYITSIYQNKLSSWYKDHVVVIGDAAHAIHPSTGIGATLAIEDGVALGLLLITDTVDSALRRFEKGRIIEITKKQQNAMREATRYS